MSRLFSSLTTVPVMLDLSPTSRHHALGCLEAVRDEGLRNVRVDNLHLLGEAY